MKILILCTGNSCRSQMAEGYLKHLNKELEVYSAGTEPAAEVNPNAVNVMAEIGVDLKGQYPKRVDEFLSQSFDYVITVCDNAKESCPYFSGEVKNYLHIGFEDPASARGSQDEVMPIYRKVRDEIVAEFKKLSETVFRSES